MPHPQRLLYHLAVVPNLQKTSISEIRNRAIGVVVRFGGACFTNSAILSNESLTNSRRRRAWTVLRLRHAAMWRAPTVLRLCHTLGGEHAPEEVKDMTVYKGLEADPALGRSPTLEDWRKRRQMVDQLALEVKRNPKP